MKKLIIIISILGTAGLLSAQEINTGNCIFCEENLSGKYTSAIGSGNSVYGQYSLVSGFSNSVNGYYSGAFGKSNHVTGKTSFAFGEDSEATGDNNFALGKSCISDGLGAFTIGILSNSSDIGSFTIGNFLANEGSYSMVLGTGVSPTERLYNDVGHSLSIGFMSTKPTFFVGQSQTTTQTGRIGIGDITTPDTKLHIKADNNEDAAIMLEPTGSNYFGRILFGDEAHSISGRENTAMVFKSDSENGFLFEGGNVLIGTGQYLATSQVRALDGGYLKLHNQNGSGINISPTGNVAIGTNASYYKLAVNGDLIATAGITTSVLEASTSITTPEMEATTSITTPELEATIISTSSIETSQLQVTDGVTNTNGMVLTSNENGLASWGDPSLFNDSDWLTNGEGKIYHPVTNVGIGTNDPKAKLEVYGDIMLGPSNTKFILHADTYTNKLIIAPATNAGAGEWDKSLTLFENGNVGIGFSGCNRFMFSFSFNDCYLDYSSFFGTKLMKTKFDKCTLKETDFSEVNLSSSVFSDCDLSGAIFSNTILEKADFRTASNFSIDPEFNKLKKAKFSAFNLEGLLFKHQLDVEYTG